MEILVKIQEVRLKSRGESRPQFRETLEWCCVWGILNQFTTKIAYSGSRQQNVLSTLLKRVLIVFNIKQISLLTSESVITL